MDIIQLKGNIQIKFLVIISKKMIGKFYLINLMKKNILRVGLIVQQFLSKTKFIYSGVETK